MSHYLEDGEARTLDKMAIDAALEAYDRSLQIDDGYATIHANRAWISMHRRDYAEAEAPLRRAIELAPENADLYCI